MSVENMLSLHWPIDKSPINDWCGGAIPWAGGPRVYKKVNLASWSGYLSK